VLYTYGVKSASVYQSREQGKVGELA